MEECQTTIQESESLSRVYLESYEKKAQVCRSLLGRESYAKFT